MMDREYSESAAVQLWVETRKGSNGAGEKEWVGVRGCWGHSTRTGIQIPRQGLHAVALDRADTAKEV